MDVLPYAIESIRLYRKYQAETAGMKSGKAKKYAKTIQKDVKDEFTDPLKNLSRTQGKTSAEHPLPAFSECMVNRK